MIDKYIHVMYNTDNNKNNNKEDKAMANRFEAYEDNGGGLYMVIMENYDPVAIFENWEAGEKGIMLDAIEQMKDDSSAYKMWEGDLLERLNADGGKSVCDGFDPETGVEIYHEEEWTIGSLYNEISENDEEIASGEFHSYEVYPEKMGYNALTAFGLQG